MFNIQTDESFKTDFKKLLRALFRLFIWGFASAALVYGLTIGFAGGLTFVIDAAGPLIGIIAPGVFAGVGASWILLAGQSTGWRRRLWIIGVILLTILIISPIGGLLWALRDMGSWDQVGVIDPTDSTYDPYSHVWRGMGMGLVFGPWMLLGFFPVTGWVWLAWYLILDKVERSLRIVPKDHQKYIYGQVA